jgi:hypothetical protein
MNFVKTAHEKFGIWDDSLIIVNSKIHVPWFLELNFQMENIELRAERQLGHCQLDNIG